MQLKHKLGKMYVLSGLAIMNYKETQLRIYLRPPTISEGSSVCGKKAISRIGLLIYFISLSKIAIAWYNN